MSMNYQDYTGGELPGDQGQYPAESTQSAEVREALVASWLLLKPEMKSAIDRFREANGMTPLTAPIIDKDN